VGAEFFLFNGNDGVRIQNLPDMIIDAGISHNFVPEQVNFIACGIIIKIALDCQYR
jgi:hypothetical protein